MLAVLSIQIICQEYESRASTLAIIIMAGCHDVSHLLMPELPESQSFKGLSLVLTLGGFQGVTLNDRHTWTEAP